MNHSRHVLGLLLLLFVFVLLSASVFTTKAQDATPTRRAPPPTNTPRFPSRASATRTPQIVIIQPEAYIAQPCDNCARLRMRETPGTAGNVVEFLNTTSFVKIIGRTTDNQWLQVTVKASGNMGWVAAEYLRTADGKELDANMINSLPITGTAVEASPMPTSSVGIPVWMSGVSSTSRQIFLKGQTMGNRANVFARVGDSITVSPYFLAPIGMGNYDLGSYSQLAGLISFYMQANARTGNSFISQPIAAGKGWSTEMLMWEGYAAPDLCGKDTPIVCEYKVVKPAVSLIMIGTNDSGSGSPDVYAGQLREIVQITIDMGIVPVLSTIPPKAINAAQTANVDAFNRVIKQVAVQYDIPLIDYFSVMDPLPNHGMSNDGLHPSVPPDGATASFTPDHLQYGFNMRNLITLQALDVLYRLVLY